jgi:type VI secretion system protein ImpK
MSARSAYADGESFLLVQFREFYLEVARWKRLAAREGTTLSAVAAGSGSAGMLGVPGRPAAVPGALVVVGGGGLGSLGGVGAGSGGTGVSAVAPATVWQALLGLLNRQEAEVRRTGGEYASAVYRRAQYVMAALADEIFLYLDWPGRESWRTNLLEYKLFQSYHAGEEVFRRIEALLRTRDPAESDLAKVYLMALALGFRGELRGPAGEARVDTYRRELYTFLTNRDPGTPREPHSLFPAAYQSNFESAGASRRLSASRRWLLGGLLLALLWIVVSHRVWTGLTEDLWPLVDRIDPTQPAGR